MKSSIHHIFLIKLIFSTHNCVVKSKGFITRLWKCMKLAISRQIENIVGAMCEVTIINRMKVNNLQIRPVRSISHWLFRSWLLLYRDHISFVDFALKNDIWWTTRIGKLFRGIIFNEKGFCVLQTYFIIYHVNQCNALVKF